MRVSRPISPCLSKLRQVSMQQCGQLLVSSNAPMQTIEFDPDNFAADDDVLRAKINAETAQIAWTGVERFFAQGKAVFVRPELDLVDVAFVVARNRAEDLDKWIDAGQVQPVSTAQAREWIEADALMWSVVVRPWVFVQPLLADDGGALPIGNSQQE
jgi:hypothetical protein